MSIRAGNILLIGGNNVVDRLQSHGLGDVRVPVDVIRETGNPDIVDKVPTEPDFTFSMESLDVTTEMEAFLSGKVGGSGSAAAPGATDPDGTEYSFKDFKFLNIPSPWKDEASGSAGVVAAGHLVPSFYCRRIRYRFGITENATQEAELAGGAFYYGRFAPVEQVETGDGATTAFVTNDVAVRFREGGEAGTTFRSVFGVIVDGVPQIRDVDYTLTGGGPAATATVATVTFTEAPAAGAQVRFAYFTTAARSWPKPVHASTINKPAAVRGRNICVALSIDGGAFVKVGAVQGFELEASVDGEVEREFCNEEIIGFTVNGRDVNGSLTVRSRDVDSFFDLLRDISGVDTNEEVVGWLNQKQVRLRTEIQNPRNPAQILKTLLVDDAVFQMPGTPARVNAATDFALRYESRDGTYRAIKGAMA